MPHPPDQPRTVIHIGPPKTGTTTLQEQIFPQMRSVCFLGKPWWNDVVPYDKCVALHRAIESVTKADRTTYDARAAAAAVQDWLAHAPFAALQADGTALPRLLSEERLSYTDVVSFRDIAQRLSQLFPGAEIVYVQRNPVSGLRSFYLWQYARAWTDLSFSDWLRDGMEGQQNSHAAVAVRSYDWASIAPAFAAYFPVVRCVRFEDMLKAPADYLRNMLGHDAEEFADLAWLKDKPLNVSPRIGATHLHRATKKAIRQWNRLPFGKIDERPEYLGDTPGWQRLEKLVSFLPLRETKTSVTDTDRNRINAYYAESMQAAVTSIDAAYDDNKRKSVL